jgi:hypothetical protein
VADDQSKRLVREGPIVISGHIYPGWLLVKPLIGIIKRDQAGHYFINNEQLGLCGVGATPEETLENFKSSLISNYQLLQANAKDDPDVQALFREYQRYLKPTGKDYYLYS